MVPREGQLRELAPPRRGLLRANALGFGSADQPVRGEGQGPRAAERPLPASRIRPSGGPCSLGPHFPVGPAGSSCEGVQCMVKGTQGARFISVKSAYGRLTGCQRQRGQIVNNPSHPCPSGSHSSAATDSSEIHRSPHYEGT